MSYGMDPHEEYERWDARQPDRDEPWERHWCDQCGWYCDALRACLRVEDGLVTALSVDGYGPACEEFDPTRHIDPSLSSIAESRVELAAKVARLEERSCEALR